MKKQLALLFFVLQSLSSSAVDLIGGVQYGETEEVVTKKLKASKFVTAELDDTIFGRVGINGSFTTTNTLNNLTFSLFFDWDHSNSNKNLKHINFRSEPLSTESYDTTLRASWKRGQTLLNALYGKPLESGEYPELLEIEDEGILFSHVWKASEGFVYLGIGKTKDKINLNIAFHKNKIHTN